MTTVTDCRTFPLPAPRRQGNRAELTPFSHPVPRQAFPLALAVAALHSSVEAPMRATKSTNRLWALYAVLRAAKKAHNTRKANRAAAAISARMRAMGGK